MDIQKSIALANGIEIPVLGLGTWKIADGPPVRHAVQWALAAGYRHVDTAALYGNERGIGEAIAQSGILREEIFLTTKLWNDDQLRAEQALDANLQRLGMKYVDLYLIHWPVPQQWKTAWKMLEKLYRAGKCRAIGVSNFTVWHLEQLRDIADIEPMVNQVEFSPFLYQKELLEFCRSKNIVLEAYSPLTRGRKLADATVQALAKKYGKTTAQVLIRWALQHKMIVIPKSQNKERIYENADVFDFSISVTDMQILDGLNENFRVSWDPTTLLPL